MAHAATLPLPGLPVPVANGVRLGRNPTLTYHQHEAIKRRDHGEGTLGEIGRSYNVGAATNSRLSP
jgi:hypothetical protein